MGIFQQFPYSNFHEMNLDQIIKIMREMQDEWAATKTEWASYKEFIDNYFNNLNLDDETEKALRRMIADGTLDPVIDPVIIAETSRWLAEHITQPTTPVVDDTLSIAGAAADAKAAGDAIDDLVGTLINYNSVGTMFLEGTFADDVTGGITFTWLEKCYANANGTGTGIIFNNIFNKQNKLPNGIEAGKKYRVQCSTTDNNLYLEVRYYAGSPTSVNLANITTDTEITIPATATGLHVRIRVTNGTTVNNAKIKFDILTEYSNADLKTLILARTRGNANVDTDFLGSCNANFGSIPDNSFSLINDMPTNSTVYCQSSQIVQTEINPIETGATYFEKISKGGFSFYRALRNQAGHEQLGFVANGSFLWYNKGARSPKKIAMFGDSTMEGYRGGGEIAPNPIPYYVTLLTGQPTTNFGVGSIGLIQKPILNFNGEEYIAQQDLTGYDVCVLMYGLNDSSGVLGTADDTTEQTFMGAVYRVCDDILTRYPYMQIILISPILTMSVGGTFPGWGYSMMRGSQAPYWNFEMMVEEYEKFSKKYHIPFINGGKCFNSWNVQSLLADNVHPTVRGYSVCGPYIAAQIAALL